MRAAASATFALKAGEWFRRGRLLMISPVHGDYRRCQAETPLIDLFKFAEPALFQFWGDAQNFPRQLRERFAQFNLELAEEKTRLLVFRRFAAVERPNTDRGQHCAAARSETVRHRCGGD
jgi:hypothetical protein